MTDDSDHKEQVSRPERPVPILDKRPARARRNVLSKPKDAVVGDKELVEVEPPRLEDL